MLTLKKVKELVEAPSHAKRTPSPKMLFEEGIVLLRREFDQGSHLTVYNSGYVLFSAGKRNTVFHIHDCCGDYAYDAAEGKGDVIKEEYFENCEWHMTRCTFAATSASGSRVCASMVSSRAATTSICPVSGCRMRAGARSSGM
jgi:hypothetical protein